MCGRGRRGSSEDDDDRREGRRRGEVRERRARVSDHSVLSGASTFDLVGERMPAGGEWEGGVGGAG